MKKTIQLLAALLISGSVFGQNGTFNVDTETSDVKWHGEKVTGSHDGTIKLKSGTISFTDDKLSGGEFVMDMTSLVCTDLEGEYKGKLEGHLKSADFFGVENYKTAKYVITSVSQQGEMYKVRGAL